MKIALFAILMCLAFSFAAGSVLFNVSWTNESTKQYPLISINLTSNYTLLCGAGDCNDVGMYLYGSQQGLDLYQYRLVNFTFYNDTRWANNNSFTTCTANSCWAHLILNATNISGIGYIVNFTTQAGNQNNQLGVLGSNFENANDSTSVSNSTYTCTSGAAFDNMSMTAAAAGPAQVCNHRYNFDYARIQANVTDTDAANGWLGFMLGNTTNTETGNFGCTAPNGCVGAVRRGTGAEIFINDTAAGFNTTANVGSATMQWRSIVWGVASGSDIFVNASRAGQMYPNALTFPFINNWTNHDDNDHVTMLQFRFYLTTSHFNRVYDYCIMSNRATLDKFGCTYSNLTTGYNFSEISTAPPAPLPDCLTSDFAVTIVPNMSNASTNITATAYYTGAATYASYNWSARTWNATLISWNVSASSNFVVNVSNYTDIGPRIFIDARGINGTCQTPIVTNSTLVFSSGQTTIMQDLLPSMVSDFFIQFLSLIVGLIIIGLAWAFTGTLSGTSFASGFLFFVGWSVISYTGWIAVALVSIWLYAAIPLIVLGLLLRQAGL